MPVTPVTLASILRDHPARFYAQQWYRGQAFLDTPLPDDGPLTPPRKLLLPGVVPSDPGAIADLPLAVTLAAIYLEHPFATIWQFFLWCRDTDARGQRIYVGGVNLDAKEGLQIHRHLHISNRWGRGQW